MTVFGARPKVPEEMVGTLIIKFINTLEYFNFT